MQNTMLAARMHEVGGALSIDTIPVPELRPNDVLVRVESCGIVPNLGNVLANWSTWFPSLPLPPMPAIFGLDPAGTIARVGTEVRWLKPGDRVYINPGRSCGSCKYCRAGEPIACPSYTFIGYFGFGARSKEVFASYPYGGLSQFVTAPPSAIVKLPDNISFDQGARFGYLGTAYSALRKGGAGPARTVLINGISGTLGLGACLLALAMGVTRILGTGRDRDLLAKVKALAPTRIETFGLGDGSISDWAKGRSEEGAGVDLVLDCLGPGAPAATTLDALKSMRRGGKTVNIGAMAEPLPLDVHWMMDNNMQLIGSVWFTTAEGQDMAAMAEAGTLDLSVFAHQRYPLERANEAIAGIAARDGGFSNFVINP